MQGGYETGNSGPEASEHESRVPYLIILKDKDGGITEVREIKADDPARLLNMIRQLSSDSGVYELTVRGTDGVSFLTGKREAKGGPWKLEEAASNILRDLQTTVRPGQWSERWLFKGDKPERQRKSGTQIEKYED